MVEQFRDVMIIIMAFIVIGATALIATLAFIIFRRISHTVDSIAGVFTDIRDVSSLVSNAVVKPTIKGVSFIAGARKVLSTLAKRSRRKEEGHGKGK